MYSVTLDPRRVVAVLGGAVLVMSGLSMAGHFLRITRGRELRGLVWIFDVGAEQSIPTWYASVSLLICAALLWIIGAANQGSDDGAKMQWKGLATIFLLLSLDEVATVHEWTANLLPNVEPEGIFYYTWLLLGIPFAALISLLYLRFLFRLPPRTRRLFVLAGAVFVGGALGMEMINAQEEFLHGSGTLRYAAMTGFEELMEMVGVLIFMYSLLVHLAAETRDVSVRVREARLPP